MVTFTDYEGTPLKPGQCIVFAATAGRAAPTIRRGVVSHFTEQRVMVQPFEGLRFRRKEMSDPDFELCRPRAIGAVPYRTDPGDTVSIKNIMVVDRVWPEVDELRRYGHMPPELDIAIASV